jgi:hypothetical protein
MMVKVYDYGVGLVGRAVADLPYFAFARLRDAATNSPASERQQVLSIPWSERSSWSHIPGYSTTRFRVLNPIGTPGCRLVGSEPQCAFVRYNDKGRERQSENHQPHPIQKETLRACENCSNKKRVLCY